MRLGDLLVADRRPVTPLQDHVYTEIGVRSFGRGIFRKGPTLGIDIGTKRVFALAPDRIVFNIVFAWEGAVGRSTDAETGTIASHRFPMFKCHSSLADLDFLTYMLRSAFGVELMGRASPGSAGRNRTLSLTALLDSVVRMPPVAEQQRLASNLRSVENQAWNLSKRTERFDALSVALLEATVSCTGQDLPSTRLSDFLTQRQSDVIVGVRDEIVQAGIYSFGRGLFRRQPISGADTSYQTMTRVNEGDFVYSKLMAWEGAVGIARADESGALASPEFPVFTIDSTRVLPGYFGTFIRSKQFIEMLRGAAVGTNVRRRVHPSEILRLAIPLPAISVQEKLAEISTLMGKIEVRRRAADDRASALLASALNQVFGSLS